VTLHILPRKVRPHPCAPFQTKLSTLLEKKLNTRGIDIDPGRKAVQRSEAMNFRLKDEEPTVLEYLRFHGLTEDYLNEELLLKDVLRLDVNLEQDLNDSRDHLALQVRRDAISKERLAVSREAALLLRSYLDLKPVNTSSQSNFECRRHWRQMKLELPLLTTDDELDLLEFGRTMPIRMYNLNIPPEKIDIEKGEGVEWPTEYHTLPAQFEQQARVRKFAVNRDDVLFLQDAIKDLGALPEWQVLLPASLNYQKVWILYLISERSNVRRILRWPQ
jgi:hypothetical protein